MSSVGSFYCSFLSCTAEGLSYSTIFYHLGFALKLGATVAVEKKFMMEVPIASTSDLGNTHSIGAVVASTGP